MNHLGPLLRTKNDRACVIDEDNELEHCSSFEYELSAPFPSRKLAKVLNVGCGNSVLSADMMYNGWMNVVNLDYSKNLIEKSK